MPEHKLQGFLRGNIEKSNNNSLHWCLDVVFHEDDCHIRANNIAEYFAVIRHIALNILRNYPIKMSLVLKRRKCEYDQDFMADFLLSSFP
jgi:hypothetical protein